MIEIVLPSIVLGVVLAALVMFLTEKPRKWHSRKALIIQLERNTAEMRSMRHMARQLSKDVQALNRILKEGLFPRSQK